jgi:hypothetical protein
MTRKRDKIIRLLRIASAQVVISTVIAACTVTQAQTIEAQTGRSAKGGTTALRASDNFEIHGWQVSCNGLMRNNYSSVMTSMVGDLGAFHVVFSSESILVRRPVCGRSGEREEVEHERSGSFRNASNWISNEVSNYARDCAGRNLKEFVNFGQTVRLLYYASRSGS